MPAVSGVRVGDVADSLWSMLDWSPVLGAEWGRLGKILQFLAGVAVVLDLVDQGRLRRHGEDMRARSRDSHLRASEHAKALQLIALCERLEADFIYTFAVATRHKAAVIRYYLVHTPPARVPAGLGLSLDEYRDFHRRVISEASTISEKDPNGILVRSSGYARKKYVDARLAELLEAQFPGARDILADLDASRTGASASLVWFFAGLLVIAGMVIAMAQIDPASHEVTEHLDHRLWITPIVLGVTLMTLTWWPVRLRLLALGRRLRARLEGALGEDLQGPRPLNYLRWLALLSFVTGSLLDLLAS